MRSSGHDVKDTLQHNSENTEILPLPHIKPHFQTDQA